MIAPPFHRFVSSHIASHHVISHGFHLHPAFPPRALEKRLPNPRAASRPDVITRRPFTARDAHSRAKTLDVVRVAHSRARARLHAAVVRRRSSIVAAAAGRGSAETIE